MTIPTQQTSGDVDLLNKAGGQTLDKEGLANNYAIEPEMYLEDGTAPAKSLADRVTVVDIFSSELEAKNAILEMERKGLRSSQISLVAQGYEASGNSMNWDDVTAAGGLAAVLTELGISDHAISQFVDAVAEGDFLVVAIGNDREASQAQHVLENVGHHVQGT